MAIPLRRQVAARSERAARPRFWRLPIALLCVLLLCAPSTTHATTGPTYYLPPARFKVDHKIAVLYVGHYTLRSAARQARLSVAAAEIELSGQGVLHGLSQFYGYDAKGNQTTWTATLFNFHLTKQDMMIVDIDGPIARQLLGRMFLTRLRNGDLSGKIQLVSTGRGRYNILWHRLAA